MIRHKRKTLKLGRSLGKMYSSITIETSKDTEDKTTNKKVVDAPASSFRKNVLEVLKREGFIRNFEEKEIKPGINSFEIEFNFGRRCCVLLGAYGASGCAGGSGGVICF